MYKVYYFNGSFVIDDKENLKDAVQVGNTIIMASSQREPFRGKPKEFAKNALSHINKQMNLDIGLFPVISSSKGGSDTSGDYTTEVVFQAVF